ncbi:restriction endonuclease subunit S [Staphylococcus arlettae]|uniref:restriction endonuclease subunit S n=1 Tax=Staphylococcus TaxID=1279 RepID=UPI000391240F|nr:restriction endonuclease subunit S [Staphylococcus sp. EGD-HP3]ERF49566.1 hypothetical protein N039_09755 [Staphylococcus sp. EGD-HP3]
MGEKRSVPKRRISKYSGAWIEKEFNDLGNFGKIYPFSRSEEGTGRFHHIHYGDIHTKSFGIVDNSSELPTIKVEENFELAKPGDIVIADASEDYKDLGKSVVIGANTNRQIIAGLHTFKFTPNEHLYPLFYLYYSQTRIFKKFSYKTGTGISVFGMSKDNLGKMRLYIPTIKEQQNIGEFFKALDERIANQKRKIDKVKALKAAYLAEMFPQEGETVPKRRFKGFEGEWRQFELAKLTDLYVGKSFTSSVESNGKYIVMDMGSVSQEGNRLIHKKTNLKRDTLLKEDLVMPKDDIGGGNIIGKTAYINQNNRYVLGDHVYRLRFQNNYGLFMHYCINSKPINKNLRRKATGSAQLGISGINVLNTIVAVPSLAEQQKIGQFFKNLDDQIEMEEKKLDKLQKMKEAYLEEMFV